MRSDGDSEIDVVVPGVSFVAADQSRTAKVITGSATGRLQMRHVGSLSMAEWTALEKLAFEHGQAPDSYLAVEPDRHCFLTSDHSAALSVVPSGRCIHISGGILASADARRGLITQLSEFARGTKTLVACYSVCEQDRPLFEEAGWEVSKFGEETSLKLRSLNWSGKSYEWVRRQFNYCQRMGLVCREVRPQTISVESWSELTKELFEIQRDDLKDRFYSHELNFLVGKLQPENLGRRRLFIAENQTTKQIEAFVVANPMCAGKAWALEMFRKRSSATRGAVPFLIKSVIDLLKAEGIEEVSLCMLLWKDSLKFKGQRTSPIIRWGLAFGYQVGNSIYHTKGLTHFKTRFRPELSNCYVCVTPKATVMSTISFFCVIGAFSFNLRNAVRIVCQGLRERLTGRHRRDR